MRPIPQRPTIGRFCLQGRKDWLSLAIPCCVKLARSLGCRQARGLPGAAGASSRPSTNSNRPASNTNRTRRPIRFQSNSRSTSTGPFLEMVIAYHKVGWQETPQGRTEVYRSPRVGAFIECRVSDRLFKRFWIYPRSCRSNLGIFTQAKWSFG